MKIGGYFVSFDLELPPPELEPQPTYNAIKKSINATVWIQANFDFIRILLPVETENLPGKKLTNGKMGLFATFHIYMLTLYIFFMVVKSFAKPGFVTRARSLYTIQILDKMWKR